MALIKQHTLTAEEREARRRNGRHSRGPATVEGKERGRAANLRHGMYSKERDHALRSLGEDPAALLELIEGSYQQWQPDNTQQSGLTEHLAHLQWRMDRAARMQDGAAAAQVGALEANRRQHATAARARYVEMIDTLDELQANALRPDFHAPLGCIQSYMKAFAPRMNGDREKMLVLLHRLREPEDLPPAPTALPDGATDDESWDEYLDSYEEAEGEEEDVPLPDVPVAEGPDRDGLRENLRALAERESHYLISAREQFFQELDAPLSQEERDQALQRADSRLERLRREEESCARVLCRVGAFLMKLQDRADRRHEDRDLEISAQGIADDPTDACADTNGRDNAIPDGAPPATSDDQDSAQNGDTRTSRTLENEGASGDVVENTRAEKSMPRITDPALTHGSVAEITCEGAAVVSGDALHVLPIN